MKPRPATRTQAPKMDRSLLRCRCGRSTFRATSAFTTSMTEPSSCWFSVDAKGTAAPGCTLDERFAELAQRRIDNASPSRAIKARASFPAGSRIRCRCGRITLISTSAVDLSAPIADDEPLDPAVPIKAASCWLAMDGNDRIAGCSPDQRTVDILARRASRVAVPSVERATPLSTNVAGARSAVFKTGGPAAPSTAERNESTPPTAAPTAVVRRS